jgi:hypothetical protein
MEMEKEDSGIKKKGDRNCTGELRPDGDWPDPVILFTSMGRFLGNRAHRLGFTAVYAVICIDWREDPWMLSKKPTLEENRLKI